MKLRIASDYITTPTYHHEYPHVASVPVEQFTINGGWFMQNVELSR